MVQHEQFVRLENEALSLVLDCRHRTVSVLYVGKRLGAATTDLMLAQLATRQEARCSVVQEAPIGLTPVQGDGYTGAPGLLLSGGAAAWSVAPALLEVRRPADDSLQLISEDALRGVRLVHHFRLRAGLAVLEAYTELQAMAELATPALLNVQYCAAPTFQLPARLTMLSNFAGRWALEFQLQQQPIQLGSYVRENRKGKTSHDTLPALLLHSPATTELTGEVYGLQLGWSGNHRTQVELLAEGRLYAQLGELLLPGECQLAAGEVYRSPTLYLSYSEQGFSGLSRQFHRFVRAALLSPAQQQKARPVHYNTWEGIYFQHDTEVLKQLASQVAALGVERFVLDDGWFLGRRGDFAGLGDWQVDPAVYPAGLSALIAHVNSCGMEFGLWFEPEMVNPDSALYRAHPDWVLQTANNPQQQFRKQLVLDVARPEVWQYLYQAITAILQQYPQIRYIKWDMNRDLNHPGNASGAPAVHQQTAAVYRLIDAIKAAQPGLEIESCSSGGGRADFGVLAHTDRIWTSDSNDALDRLAIQRGCSFFLPNDVMGAHVGPRDCHITGRRVSMAMRCAVALFGHFGIEMDPRELSSAESEELAAAIRFYKAQRQFLRQADLYRLPSEAGVVSFTYVSRDAGQALFAVYTVTESQRTLPLRQCLAGLQPDGLYQLTLAWPLQLKEYSPSVLSVVQGQSFSGESLMTFGLQLPLLPPQSALIFQLTRLN